MMMTEDVPKDVFIAASTLIQMKNDRPDLTTPHQEESTKKKRKHMEIDDSEETLNIMLGWKNKIQNINKPPSKMFKDEVDVVGECSNPVWKQVTESDVKKDQCRLMLGEQQVIQMMVEVLGRVKNIGSTVSVYGPHGDVFKMSFKVWNNKSPVLASSEWWKFVEEYGLKAHSDFLIIWMFKHQKTNQICFAIDFEKLGVNHSLSKRIKNRLLESN